MDKIARMQRLWDALPATSNGKGDLATASAVVEAGVEIICPHTKTGRWRARVERRSQGTLTLSRLRLEDRLIMLGLLDNILLS